MTRTSSAYAALEYLNEKKFDMVITTPHLEELDAYSLGRAIKKVKPELPVILLAQSLRGLSPQPEDKNGQGIDKVFIWSGVPDFLLALVKNAEDRLNVDFDTKKANVRVLLLVEDSPLYYSSFLPLIYQEVVKQTQAVLEVGLNEEHRLLTMRARPKILLAVNYEEAVELYERYQPYIFGVMSDSRLPRGQKLEDDAGLLLLSKIRKDISDLPLLLMSSESGNQEEAGKIPAVFLDKNSPNLLSEIHNFFLNHLGFGHFIFRMPDGKEVDRASNLRNLKKKRRLFQRNLSGTTRNATTSRTGSWPGLKSASLPLSGKSRRLSSPVPRRCGNTLSQTSAGCEGGVKKGWSLSSTSPTSTRT